MGCTSATAVNYNSLATDDDGTCIATVLGCTVAATTYSGVDINTPSYKSGFYGSAAKGAGGEPFPKKFEEQNYAGSAVVTYNQNANVLSGCIVAVEGCMDVNARNYDPLATINSYTWCVPDVVGCMIPDEARQKYGFNNPEVSSTVTALIPGKPDEPTSTWSSTTTRHNPASCFHARYGCNQQSVVLNGVPTETLNYDPLVTVNSVCYPKRVGCLNPRAVNYGCGLGQEQATSPCYDASYTSDATAESLRATVHVSSICKWSNTSPPPSPPPPPLPPTGDFDTTTTVSLKITAAGSVVYWDARKEQLKTEYRTLINAATDKEVTITLTDASSRRRLESADGRRLQGDAAATDIDFASSFADAAEASAATTSLSTSVGTTAASASAAFASVGVTVLAAPTVDVTTTFVARDDSSSNAGLIGGIVGGIVGALILIGIGFMLYKRSKKNKPVYPA
jgi:hypothetical protein